MRQSGLGSSPSRSAIGRVPQRHRPARKPAGTGSCVGVAASILSSGAALRQPRFSPHVAYDADGNLIEQLAAGDMNCDTVVDFFDIDRFVEALSYPGGVGWPYTCPWSAADLNGDGAVTYSDYDGFVAAIGAPGGAARQFAWDAENRLIRVEPLRTPESGDVEVEYPFD